ncbi:MAG: flagellar biosynthesis regulator FlaF [Alphaproteobacteria bacterium]|jgi:flagellar biosynthesis activator protein FlaF|nr:flagellar biosynthesis regulator FlaF [Alphaproteobacteria bacterium]MBT4019185.1 flagellar biosynthesis regulator FlaF [Alphaproteobacteria bacterium]MBT5160274.1 flagellar biosynthesis regulator FlaF [Alphaproteobacteria bacterium]
MSLQSYQTAQRTTESPRDTEYRLFALVTRDLMAAGAKETIDPDFYKSVDWNRRLWLTLQSDLSADDNQLPDGLKAQLISLAIWVDRHSSKVLRGKAEVGPLIKVNRTIMEGLAGTP